MRECKCVGSIYMREVLDQKKRIALVFGGKVCALWTKSDREREKKRRICAVLFFVIGIRD